MTIRILHTADWQIGRRFGRVPGDSGALLRQERLRAVHRIAELAAAEAADAVVVAGDVFEDNAVSDETLRRTIHALEPFAGPWLLLPGNHDAGTAASAWSRLRHLEIVPDNVVLADRPEPVLLADGGLCVLPAPLLRRHESRDVTSWFDAATTPEGALRVGLAHGSLADRLPESAVVRNQIAADRATTASLDYLALGDWHGTLQIAERTWYSGTPEPDRFRQNDAGNVLLVELDGPGAPPRVTPKRVGTYRWREVALELDVDAAGERLSSQLGAIPDTRHVLLRLKLRGLVDLSTRASLDGLLEAEAARFRWLDVDDGELRTIASEADLSTLAAPGFVGEALDELRTRLETAEEDDAARVTLALRILHAECLAARTASEDAGG